MNRHVWKEVEICGDCWKPENGVIIVGLASELAIVIFSPTVVHFGAVFALILFTYVIGLDSGCRIFTSVERLGLEVADK